MSSNKNYSEDAKNFFFNEDNKKKNKILKEKYGMSSIGESDETPPEVMDKFLEHIIAFEEEWGHAEQKKVIEVLGFPKFKRASALKQDELEKEIYEVLAKYSTYNINIDVLEKDDVSNEEFYRFLTEELPEHETDLISIPGMTTNYIYEEFHPSNKLNAKDVIEWFSFPLLKKNKKDMKIHLSKSMLTFNRKKKSRTAFMNEILQLIDEFETDAKNKIKFKSFEFDNTTGSVHVQFIISGKRSKHSNQIKKVLNLIFELEKNDYDGFDIKGCTVLQGK